MGNFITDFFSGPEVEQYNDPYKGRLDQIMSQLSTGQLGKQVASNSTGIIRRQAEDNLRAIGNSGSGRNAAVLSRLTDKNSTTADQGVINAQISGAQINQNALGQAAQIGETNRQFDYNNFERMDAQRRQPSPFESLVGGAIGLATGDAIGLGMDALFGGDDKKKKDEKNDDITSQGSTLANLTVKNSTIPYFAPPPPPMPQSEVPGQSQWEGMRPLDRYDFQHSLQPQPSWTSGVGEENYFDRMRRMYQ